MKNANIMLIVRIIMFAAMVVFAILYFTGAWEGACDALVLMCIMQAIINAVVKWNEDRKLAIINLCLAVVLLCLEIIMLTVG